MKTLNILISLFLSVVFSPALVVITGRYDNTGRTDYNQAATPLVDISPNLLWWKLNDGSGLTFTADVGPNGSTPALTSWNTGANGNPTSSAQASGDDNWLSDSSITYGTTASVSLWLYETDWDPAPSGSYQPIIISSSSSYADVESWHLYAEDGILYVMMMGTTGYKRIALGTISASAWHHIVFVMDTAASGGSGALTGYVDGVDVTALLDDTKTGSSAFTASVLYLAREQRPGATAGFYNGVVDDLRIYDYGLTAANVSAIYANPK